MSAFHLRLVNDKLNLRVIIRPLLFLHDLHNIHLMILFCKVWKNCHHLIYGAFGAPAFWNKYCHIRLWYHNSYFKILWGLQFFLLRTLYILSTPLKGEDIYEICTTFLFLALLLINTMIKVKIFKIYARFSRRSLMVTVPPFRQISFTENRQGHCQSNPNLRCGQWSIIQANQSLGENSRGHWRQLQIVWW